MKTLFSNGTFLFKRFYNTTSNDTVSLSTAAQRLIDFCKNSRYERYMPAAYTYSQMTDTLNVKFYDAMAKVWEAEQEYLEAKRSIEPLAGLNSQEKLERVAAHCGLALPKAYNPNNSNPN